MQDDPSRKLADRYDREADDYRELWAPILRKGGLNLLRAIAHSRPLRVLDVGTGVGTLLRDTRRTFPAASILGVDRSRGMLALAPSEIPRAVMDARQLALASASVDLVLMIFMLFHLDQPLDGLREARRVLRPGGLVGSLTWGGTLESRATRVWSECLDAHGADAADPAEEARHDPVDTPEKMESLLRDAGFISPRAWAESLTTRIEAEHLVRLRTRMGSSRPRFASLEPEARAACVAGARRRMEGLGAEDFVTQGSIVYAVASTP